MNITVAAGSPPDEFKNPTSHPGPKDSCGGPCGPSITAFAGVVRQQGLPPAGG